MHYLKIASTALLLAISAVAFAAGNDAASTTPASDSSQASAPSAQTSAPSAQTTDQASNQTYKLNKMTCEEFGAVDASVQPKIIYWAIGQTKGKKSSEGVIDVVRVEKIVPMVIDVCKQNPKQSFWKTLKDKIKEM